MSETRMMKNRLLKIPSHFCVPREQGNIDGRNLSFVNCRLLCAYRPGGV